MTMYQKNILLYIDLFMRYIKINDYNFRLIMVVGVQCKIYKKENLGILYIRNNGKRFT